MKTEAGVSYLIKADETTILMDVGFNPKGLHPSPLLQNMQTLDINEEDIDMIYLSLLHMDHVGGMNEQKSRTFSISQGPVESLNAPVFAPDQVKPSQWNPSLQVEIIKEQKY
jgi:7,8-dihydropterin-6-yl-methyl-4-(beta-D-ribofuranosyl)aminobenzene 5'-phosphate synthase